MEYTEKTYTEQERRQAAYALNLCAVSVAQIVDYNDKYILEQEYDAILNNLNLEQMPKDEALLNILTELLNVITFFRIQEGKKALVERKYQERMKNAVWNAVPNIGMVVAGGNLATMAISLATQVGIGYMNYRKEKAQGTFEKEQAEMELEFTAIEQFNALKRELFTTAWKLAAEYCFPDDYRLTERQIKQYNAILMDVDQLRKYERLEAVQEQFNAYPPFWYFFGHAASLVAIEARKAGDGITASQYLSRAKRHFERYGELDKSNLLREDQLTASWALEYVDLLYLTGEADREKVAELLGRAVKTSGNANDVLQLCAMYYLRIDQPDLAARLFRILVNEGYNIETNARLLSAVYVRKFLRTPGDAEIQADYWSLSQKSGGALLVPLPEPGENASAESVEAEYLSKQGAALQRDYRSAINQFERKYAIKVNRLFCVPARNHGLPDEYFSGSKQAQDQRAADAEAALKDTRKTDGLFNLDFPVQYIDTLNEMLEALSQFPAFAENKASLVRVLRQDVKCLRDEMSTTHAAMENTLGGRDNGFTMRQYSSMQDHLSLYACGRRFFDDFKNKAMDMLDSFDGPDALTQAELTLAEFCQAQQLSLPPAEQRPAGRGLVQEPAGSYLTYKLIGLSESMLEDQRKMQELMSEMKRASADAAPSMVSKSGTAAFLLPGQPEFESYFQNAKLKNPERVAQEHVAAILDDKSGQDFDLLFTLKGLVTVRNNQVAKDPIPYSSITLEKNGKREKLVLSLGRDYGNKSVQISRLYQFIGELDTLTVKNS